MPKDGLNPSNSVINANNPVHKNIRIENNTFKIFDYPVLYAKSTEGLSFINNTIERTTQLKPSTSNKNLFYFNGCNNVKIQNIIYKGDILNKNIQLKNMKRKQLKYSSELTIHSKNN